MMNESEIVTRLCRIYKCKPCKLIELAQKSRLMDICLLDKPEDKMWHAEDNSWWHRVNDSLKATSPPSNWMEVRVMFGLSWQNHYSSLAEVNFAIGPGISKVGWHYKGDNTILVMQTEFGYQVCCWNDFDPRPLMKEALNLPEFQS